MQKKNLRIAVALVIICHVGIAIIAAFWQYFLPAQPHRRKRQPNCIYV